MQTVVSFQVCKTSSLYTRNAKWQISKMYLQILTNYFEELKYAYTRILI